MITAADTGILLGDANGNDSIDSEDTLWVSLAAAQKSSTRATPRPTPRSYVAGLPHSFNIYNGDTNPADLVGEAVKWLKGDQPYVYTDGSSGKVDTNHDGILSTTEFNVSTSAFTFDANGSSRSGTALTSNLQAWQTKVDVFDGSDVVMANGQDLKNALEVFNQDKLVTIPPGSSAFRMAERYSSPTRISR